MIYEFSIGSTYKVKWNENLQEYEYFKNEILLPKKIGTLYKYLNFNQNTISSLLGSYFWLANPADLNDPFDCNKNWIVDYLENEEDKKLKRNYYEDIGIISFTEERSNQLMWAHYANNYNGIVLEFDSSNFKLLKDEDYHEDLKLVKVMYPEFFAPLQKSFKFAKETLLSSKTKSWSYENEWRIIAKLKNPKNRFLQFDPKTLKSIYIGDNLLMKNGVEMKILISIHDILYPNSKIYRVFPDQKEFGVFVIREILKR